jgi:hypothetical protein
MGGQFTAIVGARTFEGTSPRLGLRNYSRIRILFVLRHSSLARFPRGRTSPPQSSMANTVSDNAIVGATPCAGFLHGLYIAATCYVHSPWNAMYIAPARGT